MTTQDKELPVTYFLELPLNQLKVILINTVEYKPVSDFGYIITYLRVEGLGQIVYNNPEFQEVQLITTKDNIKDIGNVLDKFIRNGIRRITLPMSKQRFDRIKEDFTN